jgi:hypothetical protein
MLPYRKSKTGTPSSSTSVVTFGGDLALTSSGLGPMAADYGRQIRQVQQQKRREIGSTSSSSVSNLCGWDATHIPMRTSSVDVIISDLPFGQLCLSSAKLGKFLPLVMTECARLLRPGTGRMVLLCGSYMQVLRALEQVNQWHNTDKLSTSTDDAKEGSIPHACTTGRSTDHGPVMCTTSIWDLPCYEIFPVNIGGLLAWIVHVRRGSGALRTQSMVSHLARVKRLTHKRFQKERHQSHAGASKVRRLQG